MPDHEDRAILLRQHLELAGVKRAELFTSDAQRRHDGKRPAQSALAAKP